MCSRACKSSLLSILCMLTAIPLHAQAAQAHIDLYDGFESPTLSNLWATSRFASGAVSMQSQVVRAGNGAAKITLHIGEIHETGRNGNKDTERAELMEASRLYVRQDVAYEYSFSEFLPADFPIVPTRLVLAQWKQYCAANPICDDSSPVVAVRYSSGILRITQDLRGQRVTLYEHKEDLRNRWLDFRFRIRFTPNATGHLEAWLGDQKLVEFKGATANPEDSTSGFANPSTFYFKMGLYRDVMPEPMTMYIDEYRKRELRSDEF